MLNLPPSTTFSEFSTKNNIAFGVTFPLKCQNLTFAIDISLKHSSTPLEMF